MNEPTQAASAASARKHLAPPARNPGPPAPAAAVDFTLKPHARKRLLHAEFELVELYVDARNGKPLPQEQLVKRLEEVCESMHPATHVARGLQASPPEVSAAHPASTRGRDDLPARMPPPAEATSQAKAPMTLREAVALAELSAGPSDAEHAARLLHSALDLMQEAGADADITLPADSLCCLVADLLSGLRSARHNLAVLRETAIRHLDMEDAQ